MREEERTSFKMHREKWSNISSSDYPSSVYHFDQRFDFPFEHVDAFWYERMRGHVVTLGKQEPINKNSNSDLSNETDRHIPDDV